MVFGGRFNTACQLCRKRRIKCDEGRPGCRKCATYGRPCPGYSDTFRFAHQGGTTTQPSHHHRPSDAAQAPRAPHNHRRYAASASASLSPAPAPAAGTLDAYPPTVLAPALDLPEEIVSLCYFMNRFACRAECAGLPGYLNFLFSLYDPGRSEAFELATLSAARMVAYNRTRQTNKMLRDKSYRDHGLAVAKIRKLLTEEARISRQQPQKQCHDAANGVDAGTQATREALSDRTLGTVLLLSIFGLVNDAASRHAGSHASGIYYLLTRRGYQQGFTSRGREMMILSMVSLQADAAMRNDFKYCDFASIGILPQGSQILDPMTRVVPILELLCQRSKPLRSLLQGPDSVMFLQDSSAGSQQGRSPGIDQSDGYIPRNTPDMKVTTSTSATHPSPASSGTPTSSASFLGSPSPAITEPDDTLYKIQTAIAALGEFEAWNIHATATWAHFYEGRPGPPMLGQATSHAHMYHAETASTTILMRSYRVRFSMMLLAACQQIVQDLQELQGFSSSDACVKIEDVGHDTGGTETPNEQSSPGPSDRYCEFSAQNPQLTATQTLQRGYAAETQGPGHITTLSPISSSMTSFSDYSRRSSNAQIPTADEGLLRLATHTAMKLQHEIKLAIADMMYCIPFVLDPPPSTTVDSRGTTPTSFTSRSPSPTASYPLSWEQWGPALEKLELQPARQGFQIRDSLRLIIMCPLATPEQKEIGRVQLRRVHDIAGIRPDDC